MFKTLFLVLSTTISLTFATSIFAEGHASGGHNCHQQKESHGASHAKKCHHAEHHQESHKVDDAKKVSHGYGKSLHQQWCLRCHGSVEGEGLTGPNLSKSVETLSKEEFVQIVTHGKKSSSAIMPAWKSNPRVMKGMDQLYAFLQAHSEKAEH